MTDTNTGGSDDRVVINFAEAAQLELDSIDVGVADGVLSFDVTGRIHNLGEDHLESLVDRELQPAELHFTVAESQ